MKKNKKLIKMTKISVLTLGKPILHTSTGIVGILTAVCVYGKKSVLYYFQPINSGIEDTYKDDSGYWITNTKNIKYNIKYRSSTDTIELKTTWTSVLDKEELHIPICLIGKQVYNAVRNKRGSVADITRHINGCTHMTIQEHGLKDGARKKTMDFATQELRVDTLEGSTGPSIGALIAEFNRDLPTNSPESIVPFIS